MARKAAWEDAAESDLGPYGKSSGTRWGRVLLGVVLVASATFVAAYYLPLYRAQQKLSAEYRELNQKSLALADTASKTQSELRSVTAQRDQLQAEHEQREGSKKAEGAKVEPLRLDLATKLDKLVKKGSVFLTTSGGSVLVALDSTLLFTPQNLDLSPTGRALLCDIAKSGPGLSLRVSDTLNEGAIVPALLVTSYPNPWAFSAARAAAVAQTFEEKCAFPPGQLSSQGNGKHDPFVTPLAAAKPSPERVVLELVSR